MSRKENIVFSLLLAAISGYGFYYSVSQIKPTNLPIHHMLFPAIILGILTFLCIIRLVIAISSHKVKEETFIALKIPSKSISTIILIGLYVYTYKPLGFILSTFLYLFFQLAVLWPKKKRWFLIILIAVVCSLGLFWVFNHLLDVMLPAGVLYF